jgi:hypothetical protein
MNKLETLILNQIKRLVDQTFTNNLKLNRSTKAFSSAMADELQRQWTALQNDQADDIADFIDFDSVIAFENKEVRVLNRLDINKLYGTKDLIILVPKYSASKPNSLKQLRKYVESKTTINWSRVTFMSVGWNTKNKKSFTCDLVAYLMGKIDTLFWIEAETVCAKDEIILASWHRINSVPAHISVEVPLVKNTDLRMLRTEVDYSVECGESGQPKVQGVTTEYTTECRMGDYQQQFGRMKRN